MRRPMAGRWRVPAVRAGLRHAVAAAVLGLGPVAALPGAEAVAAGAAPVPYGFTDGARSVTGAATTTAAEHLEPGHTYRSSLPSSAKVYYRLDLDAGSTVYVSATAVPGAATTVSATDGLRVSVQDAHGGSCSYQETRFGASRSPHPIAAWGAREASAGRQALCGGAGRYYVLVERMDAAGSSPDVWSLELSAVSEPPLERAGPTVAPRSWHSASPEPVTGPAVDRPGGAGFAAASAIGPGVWRDRIRPGQTLFYRVPVDWGRQLSADAELGASSGGSGYADGALTLSLYNPVRGYVEEAYAGYSGRRTVATLAPLPPVAHANRYGFADPVRAMRFAGSYYLVVHLAARTADVFGRQPLALTLRVREDGAGRPGPGYAGRSEPGGVFEVTAGARDAATSAGAPGGSTALRVLAAGGIGTGTVVLAVLGAWTLHARRRAGTW